MLTSGIMLLHDDARPSTAGYARALLEHFNWEQLFDHPPCRYSSDVAPSDYHLFTYLKNWLGSQRFNNNEELMVGVKSRMSSMAADFFDTGTQNLFPDTTSASIQVVTSLRSSLSMYLFFVCNKFLFSLLVF
jgi:hypothetical protein